MNTQWLDRNQKWAVAVLRGVVGAVFVAHGWQKVTAGIPAVAAGFQELGLPLPYVSATLATGAEFIGGLLLLVGLLTRFAAVPIAFTMVVAIVTVHYSAFFLPAGFEYALVLLAASVALVFTGGGALALDNLLPRVLSRERRAADAALAPATT